MRLWWKGELEGGKMAKKKAYEFILGVLLVLFIGGLAVGPIIKPEGVGDFINDFVQLFWLLITIPMLVIAWQDDVPVGKIGKKRHYFMWVVAVLLAGLTVWRLPLVYSIKYIKAGKVDTERKE
jgi:hypothetical protein